MPDYGQSKKNATKDSTFTKLLEATYLGSTLYVQAYWSTTALLGKMRFYLKNCDLEDSTISYGVRIVSGSCYAGLIGAQPVGNALVNKIVDERSRFKYKSFSFKKGGQSQQVLTCDIEFCLVDGEST